MGSREGARRVNTLTSPSSGPLKGFRVHVPVMFQFFGSMCILVGGETLVLGTDGGPFSPLTAILGTAMHALAA